MGVEPNSGRVGIDVKAVRRETGNRRAHQLAAQGQHEPIVGQGFQPAWPGDGDLLLGDVDRLDLGGEMFDADRVEYLSERDGDVAEVRLVVPHADTVIGIAVDDQDFDLSARNAEFGKLARRTHRGPQTGESRTEHKNARHAQR